MINFRQYDKFYKILKSIESKDMRRADRLFRIVEFLKSRHRVVTAQRIADEMEVNIRTIYRDIRDLMTNGVPIIGEAGVGYILDDDYQVKPVMFEIEELEALMLGAQMVSSWTDDDLAKASRRATGKIAAVLPSRLRDEMNNTFLFSTDQKPRIANNVDFALLRRAIRNHHKIKIAYRRIDGETSERILRPLCLNFFGPVWLLTAWCESRDDFRNFRLSNIESIVVLTEVFQLEAGKKLEDFLKKEGHDHPLG